MQFTWRQIAYLDRHHDFTNFRPKKQLTSSDQRLGSIKPASPIICYSKALRAISESSTRAMTPETNSHKDMVSWSFMSCLGASFQASSPQIQVVLEECLAIHCIDWKGKPFRARSLAPDLRQLWPKTFSSSRLAAGSTWSCSIHANLWASEMNLVFSTNIRGLHRLAISGKESAGHSRRSETPSLRSCILTQALAHMKSAKLNSLPLTSTWQRSPCTLGSRIILLHRKMQADHLPILIQLDTSCI